MKRNPEAYKIAMIELDKRKAISWGLATRLRFDPTLEYIISLIDEIKILKALNTHLKADVERLEFNHGEDRS